MTNITRKIEHHRLFLTGLADNPPETEEATTECLDVVLMYWFEKLADDDTTRENLSYTIAATLAPFLNEDE